LPAIFSPWATCVFITNAERTQRRQAKSADAIEHPAILDISGQADELVEPRFHGLRAQIAAKLDVDAIRAGFADLQHAVSPFDAAELETR
jgi:hypothetical protein